ARNGRRPAWRARPGGGHPRPSRHLARVRAPEGPGARFGGAGGDDDPRGARARHAGGAGRHRQASGGRLAGRHGPRGDGGGTPAEPVDLPRASGLGTDLAPVAPDRAEPTARALSAVLSSRGAKVMLGAAVSLILLVYVFWNVDVNEIGVRLAKTLWGFL